VLNLYPEVPILKLRGLKNGLLACMVTSASLVSIRLEIEYACEYQAGSRPSYLGPKGTEQSSNELMRIKFIACGFFTILGIEQDISYFTFSHKIM
jgi:hypothetical protein